MLSELGLQHRINNLPKDLSGGEKQRVAIARALITNPKIIFADEPTANLDSENGKEVMRLLCQTACSQGKAVIIVSHDSRLKEMAQRILWIEDGKLVKEEAGGHYSWCKMH